MLDRKGLARRRRVAGAINLFGRAMAREMRANEHKNAEAGWEAIKPKELVADLTYHAAKLARAVYEGNPTRIIEHAADVGNLAWMTADAAGVLTPGVVQERASEPDLMEWDTAVKPAVLKTPTGGTTDSY
jgi:hypothetical protein